MKKETRVKDIAKALRISANLIHTYISLALPDHMKPKKSYHKESGSMAYTFDTQDYKHLYQVREMRKESIPYKEIKKTLEKENPTEEILAKENNHSFQKVLDFFSAENNKEETSAEIAIVPPYEPREKKEPIQNKLTLDSREVAQMVNKNHSHLIRDIETYIQYLGHNPSLDSDNFFIENSYQAGTGKEYKKYDCTKKGCEFIAHKLTGKKGALFTATYINRFHEMESKLQQPKEDSYMIQDPIERAKAWIEEQQQYKELKLTTTMQEQIIGELKPKADYVDRILTSNNLLTVSQIAEDYGLTAQAMNKLLNKLGVQYKQNGQWLLYRDHKGKGYTESETTEYIKANGSIGTNMLTKWRQKGRLFLYELLKENGVLPTMELI